MRKVELLTRALRVVSPLSRRDRLTAGEALVSLGRAVVEDNPRVRQILMDVAMNQLSSVELKHEGLLVELVKFTSNISYLDN